MTTEPIAPSTEIGWEWLENAPATNEQINGLWIDTAKQPEADIIKCMIVRAKSDAKTIAELREQVERLKEKNARCKENAVDWIDTFEDQARRSMNENTDLRAENAAQAKTIAELRAKLLSANDECQQRANEMPKMALTNTMLRAEVQRLNDRLAEVEK